MGQWVKKLLKKYRYGYTINDSLTLAWNNPRWVDMLLKLIKIKIFLVLHI